MNLSVSPGIYDDDLEIITLDSGDFGKSEPFPRFNVYIKTRLKTAFTSALKTSLTGVTLQKKHQTGNYMIK